MVAKSLTQISGDCSFYSFVAVSQYAFSKCTIKKGLLLQTRFYWWPWHRCKYCADLPLLILRWPGFIIYDFKFKLCNYQFITGSFGRALWALPSSIGSTTDFMSCRIQFYFQFSAPNAYQSWQELHQKPSGKQKIVEERIWRNKLLHTSKWLNFYICNLVLPSLSNTESIFDLCFYASS